MSGRTPWSREQLLVAFGLYCQIPFGKLHAANPTIKRFAECIGRTPSALAMKLANIASLDPAITETGRRGLPGASAADRALWYEMQEDWGRFALESEQAIETITSNLVDTTTIPEAGAHDHRGGEATVSTTTRIGQQFFRKAVLSAYDHRCCITGLSVPSLLIASHIIPWRDDEANRINPANGLALSALHDRAFDLGYITVDETMCVKVAHDDTKEDDPFYADSLLSYEGKQIRLPDKFHPGSQFLAYHRSHIFRGSI